MPILTPPYAMTGTYSDGKVRRTRQDLWQYFTYAQGQAIVKRDGKWQATLVAVPDIDTEIFLGGYQHVITQAKADELTLAGFGAYIGPDIPDPFVDPPGFGEGSYGTGEYGD